METILIQVSFGANLFICKGKLQSILSSNRINNSRPALYSKTQVCFVVSSMPKRSSLCLSLGFLPEQHSHCFPHCQVVFRPTEICPGVVLAYTQIQMRNHKHCFVRLNLNIAVIISMCTKGNLSSCLGKLLFTTCYADLCLGKSVLPCQAPIKKKHLTAPSNSLNKTAINRLFCA